MSGFYSPDPCEHCMSTDIKVTSARAFVRSLNILLKFARLYGFDHPRTNEQFQAAWTELRGAMPTAATAGLLARRGR